jgi:hypothetical protein
MPQSETKPCEIANLLPEFTLLNKVKIGRLMTMQNFGHPHPKFWMIFSDKVARTSVCAPQLQL